MSVPVSVRAVSVSVSMHAAVGACSQFDAVGDGEWEPAADMLNRRGFDREMAARWFDGNKATRHFAPTVSVNVSGEQLYDPDFIDLVQQCLRDTRATVGPVDPGRHREHGRRHLGQGWLFGRPVPNAEFSRGLSSAVPAQVA